MDYYYINGYFMIGSMGSIIINARKGNGERKIISFEIRSKPDFPYS